MPNKQNIQAVKDLTDKLDKSQAVFLADYSGLTVKQQTELRMLVRQAGGELVIAKNRLLKIAMQSKGLNVDDMGDNLKGANVTLFAESDPIAPLKVIVDFAKKSEIDKPAVKSGILGKEVLSITKILQLANLPSKLELIAKLLGTLSNPARNLVGVLSAPTRDLVYALSAIKDKK